MSPCLSHAEFGPGKATGGLAPGAESQLDHVTLADERARGRSIARNTPGRFVAQRCACANFFVAPSYPPAASSENRPAAPVGHTNSLQRG
jgi:hypothetical protein